MAVAETDPGQHSWPAASDGWKWVGMQSADGSGWKLVQVQSAVGSSGGAKGTANQKGEGTAGVHGKRRPPRGGKCVTAKWWKAKMSATRGGYLQSFLAKYPSAEMFALAMERPDSDFDPSMCDSGRSKSSGFQ